MTIKNATAEDVSREMSALRYFLDMVKCKGQGGDNIFNVSISVNFFEGEREDCHLHYMMNELLFTVLVAGLNAHLSLLEVGEKQLKSKEKIRGMTA